MTALRPGRDGDVEAFVVDRYLESLLARHPIDVEGVPAELEATASRLAAALPRFHPSFRFEEELAARLAAAAGKLEGGTLITFPRSPASRDVAHPDRMLGRPALIGGVLTSAALSLAGAVIVARRLARPSSDTAATAAAPARLT